VQSALGSDVGKGQEHRAGADEGGQQHRGGQRVARRIGQREGQRDGGVEKEIQADV